MRYLFVTSYPPTRCGIGAYASQSVKKLRTEGHVVDTISPNNEGNVDFKCDLCGGFKALKLLKLGLFYDRMVIQYHPAFFFKSYDNISSKLQNLATNISLILLFLLYWKKIEIVCHEIQYYDAKNVGWLKYISYRLPWLLGPKLVFHTQKELDYFRKKLFLGIGSKRLELRAHDRDFVKFREISQQEARRELGVPLDATVFLCIGFVQPHKGFDRAVTAFDAANPANARLYIVGSLRLTDDNTFRYRIFLRSLASHNPNIVIVEKFVSDQEFDTWISASDYVLAPYRVIWSSGVVARARLFGKKVIASEVGGLPDQLSAQDLLFVTDAELETLIRRLTVPHDELSACGGSTLLP